jgi:hypothetical protein
MLHPSASHDEEISMDKTFSSEFPKAQRLVLTLRKSLSDLDRYSQGQASSLQDEFSRSSIEKQAAAKVHVLTRGVQLLGTLLDRDASDPRAQQWRHRLGQLAAECEEIRVGVEKHVLGRGTSTRERLIGEHGELLHRRNRGVDAALAEQEGLGKSLRRVDELNELGNSVLKSLRDQRVYIKSAHRRALDFINVTGISRSLLGMIERRNVSDQRILVGGMILTLLVIGITYYFFRS